MLKVNSRTGRGRVLGVAASLVGSAVAVSAHGAVLFSDTFTAPDGTALPGRAPDGVDTGGATYAANGGNAFTNAIVGNRAQLGVDEAAALPTGISSTTTYTLSDLFNDGNVGGADQNDRGEGLGFFSAVASGSNGYHGDGNFLGLTVSPAGVVNLISVTPSQAITTYSTATVSGYNATADHTLSYTVDTAAGLISNVRLDGAALSLTAPAGLFTPADTAYAGFTVSANALGESATYDNFALSAAVPEPTAIGLVAVAAGLRLARRRRTV